jgi:hypothetical protein
VIVEAVTVAERRGDTKVASLYNHFRIVESMHGAEFEVLP